MPTAKAMLNKRYQSKDNTYPIIIRLTDGKKQKEHKTGYKVKEKFWIESEGQVSSKHPEADIINSVIDEEVLKAKRYFADCKIKGTPVDLDLTFAEVQSHSFTKYLKYRLEQHEKAEEVDMAKKCRRFVKELADCFLRELFLSDINMNFLRQYDAYLIGLKNRNNTRIKKLEFLGKYYRNALKEKKAVGEDPFKDYYIQAEPVKKEKLTAEQLAAIEALQLTGGPTSFARDLWLFSYYCKGARFENCITMKKSSVVGGRLYFQINKGKRHLSVLIHPKLQEIIDRHINNDTDTIFGRFNEAENLSKSQYKNKVGSENFMVNRSLKDVARLANIPIALSMHHARHTLAYHLKKVTDNMLVIQDALGHSRAQITETYLKELDDEHLDGELSKVYNK